MTWVIVLVLLGILLLLVEILLLPGIHLAGVIGLILMVLGVFLAYNQLGVMQGTIALIVAAVVSVFMLILALRSKTWKRVTLHESVDSQAVIDYTTVVKPGDEGRTISRLAPMGKALINSVEVEVTAVGELIDQQQNIVVVKVEENRIIVKLK